MKIEYGIIITAGILVFASLGFIASNPNVTPYETALIEINDKGIEAKKADDNGTLEEYRSMMGKEIDSLATRTLQMPNLTVFLEEHYFPFVDASEIELFDKDVEQMPICDIAPKIPSHLEIIKNSEMFRMFAEKYHQNPTELFIQDERKYQSIIHYSIVATSPSSGNAASMWVHLNSCNDEMTVPYNLSCRDKQSEKIMHTRNYGEIVASLNDEKFCEIVLEPWRQELYDYTQKVSDEMKIHQEKMSVIKKDPTFEKVMAFQSELERLGLLGNMAGHAMDGEYEDQKMKDMKKEYREKFGDIPDELLELIDK